jgi:hypothetical protein
MTKEEKPKVYPKKIPHAYQEYEGTHLWSIVDKALDFLERNKDITIDTRRVYVVGYLCKAFAEGNERWLLCKKS